MRLIEDIVNVLDRCKNVLAHRCDLTKAFDCVSPNIVKRKLEHYCLNIDELGMLHSYQSTRCQSVFVISSWCTPESHLQYSSLFISTIYQLRKRIIDLCFTLMIPRFYRFSIAFHSKMKAPDFLSNQLKFNKSKTRSIIFSSD